MKILVYSDLHLEFSDFSVPCTGYDVVVLAGDIHLGDQGIKWAQTSFPDTPVIYICGNHEYYHRELNEVQRAIRAQAAGSNVNFCENETVQIAETRFLCATLWTDFCNLGNPIRAKISAGFSMNDYHIIEYGTRPLLPDDTEGFHWRSRRYLESELSASVSPDTRTVVVTHHAPSVQSLRYERIDDEHSPAYVSRMDDLIQRSGADLWIHGHTHESADYRIENTRVLSNPRGYSYVKDGWGNKNFKQDCIIEI